MELMQMKKDFQKVVKGYRDLMPMWKDWWGNMRKAEYPKAMMTNQQMTKRTATVNFGYKAEKTEQNLKDFIGTMHFAEFCEKYGVQVVGAENHDNYIWLRLKF